MSLYLQCLEDARHRGATTISSEALAQLGGTTSAQIRHDLAMFGSFGRRGLGYPVPELVAHLREILGLNREWRVIVIGAGRIGSALAQFPGFAERGFVIVGVYDSDPRKIGHRRDGHSIRNIADLAADASREHHDIAVLAVPVDRAQAIADLVVGTGIMAILNFASAPLHLPAGVIVNTVNMTTELELLSYALAHRR